MKRNTEYHVIGWTRDNYGMPITLGKATTKNEATTCFNNLSYNSEFEAFQIDEVINYDTMADVTTILYKDEEHGLVDDIEALNDPGEDDDYDADMYLM
jgi:hypothetical protein